MTAISSHLNTEFDRVTPRAWLEAIMAPAIVLDENAVLIAHNTHAEDLLQHHIVTAVGKPIQGPFKLMVDRVRRQAGLDARAWFEQPIGNSWYRIAAYPLRARPDGPTMQVIIATDITPQKHSEFEIRESEAQLEEATRIAQLGTYKIFWERQTVHWSPHMYVIHGVTPGTSLLERGKYAAIVHPEDQHLHARYMSTQYEGKALNSGEYRIIRKDGSIRWLRLDARVLFDSDGEPYATFGTCQDVTEGKQREQELRNLLRRNAILYEALNASPIGVAVVTTDSPRPEVFYVNAAFEHLTGHKTSSLAKRSIGALIPGDSPENWDRVTQALLSSGAGAFELKCARRDGTTFLAQIEVAPVRDYPGRDANVFVLNLRDITVDRQRAEALLQSQKMEALGQLSGGVAHEINNLLQPMLSLSELGRDLVETDPAKVRRYFEVIASSGRKARDVVRQILTFARRDTPEVAAYSIAVLTRDALHLLQSGLPPGVKLIENIDTGDAQAMVNPTQVSQVVLNLVKNAADAMNGTGNVTVELTLADIDDAEAAALTIAPGRWIRLRVADEGSGMDAYTLSRVFEPFFTTKVAGKGTGLGLSVVYSIVNGWGGGLKMESDVDKGTAAMIYIPVVSSP
jgi:PAS domain S-box-containing protein